MFPRLNPSDAQMCNLRRPYSTRRGNGRQDSAEYSMAQQPFDYLDGHLDLSIHHPSTPFGNRFAPLTRPEAIAHRDREFHASRPRRRSRNSRGTKDAKKSRDSRRNKRKMAVHLLNEQLSRNIEDTLFQYNIPPMPPASDIRTNSVSQHVCGNGSAHVAPSAPQLPPITFHGFSLPDFPPLTIPRMSVPPSPHPVLVGVPAWCPPIPSLTSTGSTGELPKFYDLSCLQEPKCQDLQLWRGSPVSVSKKQSRFFPPRPTSPKPTVRLPPTGPKCSIPGAGLHDPSDMAWKSSSDITKPDSITQAIERIIAAAVNAESVGNKSQPPSAANLWNILVQSTQEPADHTTEHIVDWKNEGMDVDDRPVSDFNGRFGPFELAGNDFPYVHNNSLTGYANEAAANHSGDILLGDSALYLAEMISSSNNAHALSGLHGMPLTHSPCPSTPKLLASDSLVSPTSTAQPIGEELGDSVAHFNSEQELFAPPLPMERSNPSRPASTCDLSTFLSMGHAENCWCLACEEEPELISEEVMKEPEDAFTEEDGWLVWSAIGCEDESTVFTESSAAVEEPKSEKESPARRTWVTSQDWDDFSPRKPRRNSALNQSESDIQFLGYYDDGACFAHADEDESEWEWNF